MTSSQVSTNEASSPTSRPDQPTPPAALPDAQNPAILDAQKAFNITVIGSALFIGAVLIFIL